MTEDQFVMLVLKNKAKTIKVIIVLTILALVIYDLFYSGIFRDKTFFFVVTLIIIGMVLVRIKSKEIFFIALGLLFLYGYNLLVGSSLDFLARIVTWVYIFLLLGVIKQFFELKRLR